MSAPLSPRTEAILDAAYRLGVANAAAVVERLDLDPPDPRWTTLAPGDRASTVRRYLGRLVDAGELRRLEDGTYLPVWTTPTTVAAADDTARHNGSEHVDDDLDDLDDLDDNNDDNDAPTHRTRHTEETPAMTETTDAETTKPRTARALLDECPHGPWPADAYDRMDVVVRLDARRVELTSDRDDALALAATAEAAEAEAIVDGDDAAAHAAEATRHRDHAATLARALASLDTRRRSAALLVLDAQEEELVGRAHAARRAVPEHIAGVQHRLAELAAYDGDHWREATLTAPRLGQLGRTRSLERAAESAADLVAAVRAVLDDMPLGFPGAAGMVNRGRLATLTGVDGVPPLVDVEVLRGEDALSIEGHGPLINELSAELAETPIR
ncbi:hypothetical protein [Nocardioides sp. GXZ039]|uniref:hypothetical protein n=1 Tax=Nocardioides sp. GXZ039 TaxID=3136018 RepID=UPI0030F3792C